MSQSTATANPWMALEAYSGRGWLGVRSHRVLLLVGVIVALSGVDLYLTLLYLTNNGMPEANPFARLVIEYNSPAILAAWKVTTVALAGGILIRMRKNRSAEIGAWIGCLVLVWLSIHWARYAHAAAFVQETELAMGIEVYTDDWVSIRTPGKFYATP